MPEKNTRTLLQSHFLFSALTIIFVLFFFTALYRLFTEVTFIYKPVVESPKTEMVKLPTKFQKKVVEAKSATQLTVPILMYHYVEYVTDTRDTLRQKLNVTPYTFEKEILTLQEAGYTFMTAKELGEVIDGKHALPAKPILLTFDDGHRDFATDILPILKKHHVKATAYIIPGFTGGSDFMTHEQVQAVVDSGLVDVGAHTVHHLSLKGLPPRVVMKEVRESKEMLEKAYSIKVVSFAYPNGSFDERAFDIVKEAGYTTAVSTIPGETVSQSDRFFLFRLRPGSLTGEYLLSFIEKEATKNSYLTVK